MDQALVGLVERRFPRGPQSGLEFLPTGRGVQKVVSAGPQVEIQGEKGQAFGVVGSCMAEVHSRVTEHVKRAPVAS